MANSIEAPSPPRSQLKRSITVKQLYFYVVGDVLGSGIYVLVGLVAAAVGGAFWMAFLVGVSIATITGLAYAELVTKYPQAAGASLYINKAFRSPVLTFFITICMLSANMAAVGSLAAGFVRYLSDLIGLPESATWATTGIAVAFVAVITAINLIGISESVVANVIMTFVEISGLIIVVAIGVIALVEGVGDPAVLLQFQVEGGPGSAVLAVLAGVSLAFFAMTGFENAANVAEETIDPSRAFPRALIGGMMTAGVVYVLVSMAAALAVPIDALAGNTLLEVVRADLFFIPAAVMLVIFGLIAMVAISNTALVTVVAQSRILFGMARENVVPAIFAKVHPARRSPYVALIFGGAVVASLLIIGAAIRSSQAGIPEDERLDIVDRLATITVVFLLFIYALVIVACLKLRGHDERDDTYRANTPLLVVGILGNVAVLIYTLVDDPGALFWVGGLLALGLVLYLAQRTFGAKKPDLEAAAGVAAAGPTDREV
ncbi:APC family permease [Clavibacter michiganensis]|uniref:APC family permease n=1 Tax=Clavibacter michiganensis TaxID=28447 RepID=UPI000A3C4C8B|nr:APC family permease [Clavibacter michiganensis]MDO4100441.1 APC family permease [Clavibacter michiganensis]MDO4129007.1 APC family permease [Clavibacter michiganensis]NIY61109.1 amino acid permease [Clavibacter michiganensis subsp. michiganensis]OUE18078.1 putative amino acid permease YhdG [Clavibacter michiganensis subsp. michiganensis]QXP02138.1 APC family permease [Clavibacter michiganensis subsp. michiganensis]